MFLGFLFGCYIYPECITFYLRCSLENPVPPLNPHMLPGLSLGSLEFSSGSRVLARREVDGFYYLGTVIQPVQVKKHFDKKVQNIYIR